jgi:hypothetical protein
MMGRRWCVRTRGWLPRGRVARRSRTLLLGGMWLRCLTWWRRPALDTELAHGIDPIESDELSLRAGQLRSARRRARLAYKLEGAVALAHRQIDPFNPVTLRRAEVRACQPLLIDLAEHLREAGPLDVQGLAMTTLLVSDGSSPLYREATSLSLTGAAISALGALERPDGRTGPHREAEPNDSSNAH